MFIWGYDATWREIGRWPLSRIREKRPESKTLDRIQSVIDKLAFSIDYTPYKAIVVAGNVTNTAVGYWWGRPVLATLVGVVVTAFVVVAQWAKKQSKISSAMRHRPNQNELVNSVRANAAGIGSTTITPEAVVYDKALNVALNRAHIEVVALGDYYRLPEVVVEYLGRYRSDSPLRGDTTNDLKIRLCSDLLDRRGKIVNRVEIEKTDYFSTQWTNEMSQFDLRDASGNALVRGSDYWHANGEIRPLERAGASNQIGISTLCITSDGYLVTQLGGNQERNNDRINASGSGSLDWSDYQSIAKSGLTLNELVASGMERELREEICAKVASGKCITFMTGYARLLRRGGKPEFFGLTILAQPVGELREGERRVLEIFRDKIRMDNPHTCADDIEECTSHRLKEIRGADSFLLSRQFALDFLRSGSLAHDWSPA